MAVIAVVQQLEKKTQGKKKKKKEEYPGGFCDQKTEEKMKKNPNYFYKISRGDEDDKPV